MDTVLATSLLLFALLIPTRADAQVLTVEVEGMVEVPVDMRVGAPVRVDAILDGAPLRSAGALVLVRPEGDARIALSPVAPTRMAPPLPRPPAYTNRGLDDMKVNGSSHLGFFGERMDLGDIELNLGQDPEVQALRGLRLGPDWGGRGVLRDAVTGGVSVDLGMRAGYLRGPDVRLFLGGGELEGRYAPLQGAPGMELAVTSIFFARVELALGVQIPLGPVTPYVIAIGSLGVAFVDVAVRDATLGGLGSETIDTGLFSAGFEAGIDVEMEGGLELDFAFRANVVGATSMGGIIRLGFGGE